MSHERVMERLEELRAAQGLVAPIAIARMAMDVLRREGEELVDLADFLAAKGLSGYPLAVAVQDFGQHMAEAYTAVRGFRPMKAARWVEGVGERPVNVYTTADLVLMDEVYARWVA